MADYFENAVQTDRPGGAAKWIAGDSRRAEGRLITDRRVPAEPTEAGRAGGAPGAEGHLGEDGKTSWREAFESGKTPRVIVADRA